MLIDELEKGSAVILQYVSEDGTIEITSKVAGIGDNAILAEPIKSVRNTGRRDIKNFDGAVCNLFADDNDGKRVGWFNVIVKTMDYKQHSYYLICTRSFNRDASLSDRRGNDRIKLEGMIARVEKSDVSVKDVYLYDMSNNGISFFGSGSDDYLNRRLAIRIEDVIDNEEIKVSVHCTCVRAEKEGEDGRVIFGCRIGEAERPYLTYIFRKRLELKKHFLQCAEIPDETSDETPNETPNETDSPEEL